MKFSKSLIAKAVAGLALIAGVAAPSFAAPLTAPTFQINPGALGGTDGAIHDCASADSPRPTSRRAYGHDRSPPVDPD